MKAATLGLGGSLPKLSELADVAARRAMRIMTLVFDTSVVIGYPVDILLGYGTANEDLSVLNFTM